LISRSRPRDGVSRVAPVLVVYVPSPLPRWSCWMPVALFSSSGSFPCVIARSASTSLFSGPAQRSLALQPAHSRSRLTTLSIEGFRQVVAFPPAPIATGWSDPCRKGLSPSQELCLSTAHDYADANPPWAETPTMLIFGAREGAVGEHHFLLFLPARNSTIPFRLMISDIRWSA